MSLFDPDIGLRVAFALRIAVIALTLLVARRTTVCRWVGFIGCALASLVTAATAATMLQAGASRHGELFLHRASQFSLNYTVDGLSAWFLIVLSTLAIPIAIFSIGYFAHGHLDRRAAFIAATFNVLVGAVELVFVASDAITFLFAWELMTLTAAALVTTEHEERDSRRAAYLYLVMSHVGTGCLIAGFLALASASGSVSFSTLLSGDVARGPMRDVLFGPHQLETGLGVLGGPDAAVGWIGDTAIVINDSAGTPEGGLGRHPDRQGRGGAVVHDPAFLHRLRWRPAGHHRPRGGLYRDDDRHRRDQDLAALTGLGSAGASPTVPMPAGSLTIAYAVTGDIVVVGSGAGLRQARPRHDEGFVDRLERSLQEPRRPGRQRHRIHVRGHHGRPRAHRERPGRR